MVYLPSLLHMWDMYQCKPISKGFLLEVSKSVIGYVVEGAVIDEFEDWLVVHCDDEIVAAKDKNCVFSKASATAIASPSMGA